MHVHKKCMHVCMHVHKKATNLGKMYLLPKIHKRLYDVPGRPVISNCGTPTEKASEFLDNQLKEVMQNGWSYIKDSNDFKHLKNIPDNALLVTSDVVGLYPSIPHEAGLRALKEVLDRREEKKISTEDLVKMAEFVLKNNYFEFNGQVKHQISGTAIGTKFAPTYACIFIDEVETNFLETQEFQPLVWFRYIDDVFFIWTHGPDKLVSFMTEFNNYHPNIKFTYESNKENITFLDLNVSLSGSKLTTDLHTKSTDKHQYLHYTSAHSAHTKRSIIYSQALRMSRICSYKNDFEKHLVDMKSWFQARGYPSDLIQKETNKVKFSGNRDKNKSKKKSKGVPLVITFHPLLKDAGNIIHKNLYLLYMDQEAQRVFTPGPMITFRSARKLSSYLVRAKLYPLERTVGSCKCYGNRCEVCDNVTETSTFTSTVTQNTYKINHQFNCSEKCLVYLLTCNKCFKQYVGQTVDEFRRRWNNYKSNDRKFQRLEPCMQEHLFSHFSMAGHNGFLNDVSITFIDKTDPTDPLRREDYWRQTLKTMVPYGLNIEDSV